MFPNPGNTAVKNCTTSKKGRDIIPEEHLYYFNRRNIATLLSKQGVVFE